MADLRHDQNRMAYMKKIHGRYRFHFVFSALLLSAACHEVFTTKDRLYAVLLAFFSGLIAATLPQGLRRMRELDEQDSQRGED